MAFVQRMLLLAGVAALGAMAAPQRGNNEYLPPNKGYDYPKPNVPFTSAPPTYRPPQNNPVPPPTYRPNPPQPTYGPPPVQQPTYRPPQNIPVPPPTYRPNPPQPTYGPPPVQQPTYRPPQNNPVPPPTYRPNPPQPTYGPPPVQQPDYVGGSSGNLNNVASHDHGHGHDHVHEAGMPYDFNYAVKDDYYGTDFSQNEASDGDNVKGEYRVQLPDGRLQIVTYTADWKTGFHAVVTYQGEAKFPEQAPYVPQPSNNNPNRVQGDNPNKGYDYQPPQTPIKPPNSYGAPSY